MNLAITGRHMEITPSLREYAEKKIKKLEKYFHQLIDARVILFIERVDHVAEIVVNGDGVQFHAIEKAGDMYSSIDLLYDKIEKQIIKHKEKHSDHKAPSLSTLENPEDVGDEMIRVALKQVSNKPFDIVEAFLQMRVDDADFMLFKRGVFTIKSDTDYLNRNYAIIYRAEEGLKMIEIPDKVLKRNSFHPGCFLVYDIKIVKDSPTKPKIKLKKCGNAEVHYMTLGEALKLIAGLKSSFVPFFNTESKYLNVLYRDGDGFAVMVPPL